MNSHHLEIAQGFEGVEQGLRVSHRVLATVDLGDDIPLFTAVRTGPQLRHWSSSFAMDGYNASTHASSLEYMASYSHIFAFVSGVPLAERLNYNFHMTDAQPSESIIQISVSKGDVLPV